MSLRWRIAATLGLVAALVCAFGAIAAYVTTSQRLENTVDESLIARKVDLSHARASGGFDGGPNIPSDGDDPPFQRPGDCPSPSAFAPATSAQFVDIDGTRTSCIEGSPTLPTDAADRAIAQSHTDQSRLRTVEVKGKSYRVLTVGRLGGGAFQIGRSLGEVDGVLSSLKLRLGLIGAIGVAGAVLAGWLIAGRIVKPIDRLRVTAEDIARTQDLTTPVPTEGAAEIGSLSRSFNTMVDALATSRNEQQRLVGDASHELRTPLTSLRTNAELLARADELGPGEYDDVVEGVQLEIQELTDLVSELVELAGDSSGSGETPETVELVDLARDVAMRARRRSGREIDITATGTGTVLVRPQILERAIGNLVDNALKYSDDSTSVDVVIDDTKLEVLDRGSGFADVDLPHVFDRFYRSVEARTQSGSGLGLAIVRQAVERHGGTVWAKNRVDGGAVVGFELPTETVRTREPY
jgi:two-component system sensor histidine kinase MprB